MSRDFEIEKDPYDLGYSLYKKKNITINPGITVLVGCNGVGKTTLLHNVRTNLRKNDIPVLTFDNLTDGGNTSRQSSLDNGDMSFLIASAISSEGENIILNMSKLSQKIGNFIKTGDNGDSFSKFVKLLRDDEKEEHKEEVSNERWILLDAIDSGLSIDNIIELKNFFNFVILHEPDKEIYFVITANSYEMANGSQCFDVAEGKYITFSSYEDYKKMIIQSRNKKDKRDKRSK